LTSYAVTPATPGLINIQFGGGNALLYTGAGATGGVSDKWNKPTAFPYGTYTVGEAPTSLIYADGTSAGPIQFSYTADVVHSAAPQLTGFGSTTYAELMRSYVSTSNTSATAGQYDQMDFSGLNAGQKYQIWVLTQTEDVVGNYYGNDQNMQIQFADNLLHPTGPHWQTTTNSNGLQSSFNLNQNYLTGYVTANTDGTIHMFYSSPNAISLITSTNNAAINGVQMATPEPASMLLIGVGGALMSASKLRKKKAAEKSIA